MGVERSGEGMVGREVRAVESRECSGDGHGMCGRG